MTEIEEDFQILGESLVRLYSQAINGVVCDPLNERCCLDCKLAWGAATKVLNDYDSDWGNTHRLGNRFQPL